MKPRLIILSDLWGFAHAEWLSNYLTLLTDAFEVKTYNCHKLGEVDISSGIEQQIHHQFVTGGIDKAVVQLLSLERQPVHVLAFSVGGAIAWKAALQGLKMESLWAVSSTRLRHEQVKPVCTKMHFFFGEDDLFMPDKAWFEKFAFLPEIVKNQGHLLYQDADFVERVSHKMVKP